MSDAVQIEGLAELSDLLQNETVRAAKRYLRNCIEPCSQIVLDAAAETVPVGHGVLEEALGYEVGRWQNDDGESSIEIRIGPLKGYFWGSIQEFGSVTNPAQHWLQRAWESCKDAVLNEFSTNAVGLLLDLQNKKGN